MMNALRVRCYKGYPQWVLYMGGILYVGIPLAFALSVSAADPLKALEALPLVIAASVVFFMLFPHDEEFVVEGEWICITRYGPWGMRRTRRVRYEKGDVINYEEAYRMIGLFDSFKDERVAGKVCLRRGTKRIRLFSHYGVRAEFGRVVAYLREQTGLADHTRFAPSSSAGQKLSGEKSVLT